MGLNVVVGCPKCRIQAWIFRGYGAEIEQFYRDHWDCVRTGSVLLLSDDQTSQPWVDDPNWEQITLPARPYLAACGVAAQAYDEGFAAGRSAERARLAERLQAHPDEADMQAIDGANYVDRVNAVATMLLRLRAALSEGSPE